MYDPVTAILLAAAGGGQLLKGYEANKTLGNQINARNAVTQAELERQRKYGAESRGFFDTAVNTFDPTAQKAGLAGTQNKMTGSYTGNAPIDVGRITTARAPASIGASENRTVADVFEKAAGKDAALGALKGYGQQRFDDNLVTTGTGRDIDVVGDFSKVSSGVNALEQRAAFQNAYKPPSIWGDLLTTGGQLGAFYGGKGAFGGNTMFNPNPGIPSNMQTALIPNVNMAPAGWQKYPLLPWPSNA